MEIKEGELIMGVGNGGGNLFVKDNYESITVLQNKLLELKELRRKVAEYGNNGCPIVNHSKDLEIEKL